MKGTIISTLILAPFIALSSAAMAQGVGMPPTQTQQLNNADTQNREGTDANSVHKGQHEYFKSLDGAKKGYLTLDDVSADAFLTQNYGKCDSDHDGKLTWPEFKMCTRNNPPLSSQ
jgi:hypothetical protein